MSTTDPRVEARARANRRLRRMTIGTTALGIAATGALGWTAAVSYDGGSTSSSDVALVTTTGTASPSATSSASSTSSSSSSSTSTSTAPIVSSGSGTAQATTGGS